MNSWIKLSRHILDWEWYHDDGCKALLLHLMLRANWQEKNFAGITQVKPGEFVTSQQHLAMELGKTRQQIRTLLKKLEKTGTIKVDATNGFTHIKLIKYYIPEIYPTHIAPDGNLGLTHSKPTRNHFSTPPEPCTNPGSTTTKEHKSTKAQEHKNKKIKEREKGKEREKEKDSSKETERGNNDRAYQSTKALQYRHKIII